MQILIDISEEYYNEKKKIEWYLREYGSYIDIAVLDGIILPKSHGDLIDRDVLKSKYVGWYNLATGKSIRAVQTQEIDWMEPIIGAKEGENE